MIVHHFSTICDKCRNELCLAIESGQAINPSDPRAGLDAHLAYMKKMGWVRVENSFGIRDYCRKCKS